MGLYKNNNGVLSPIAGRGKAEYGASTVRKGTAIYTGEAVGQYPAVNVTFDIPMPDADYEIFFDYDESSGHGELNYMGHFGVYKRTANGFQIVFAGAVEIYSGWNVKYTAFKLYTDNEYNGLLNNQRYSTDEIDTGKTWIDGKKIYRKVITFTTTSPGSSLSTPPWTKPANSKALVDIKYLRTPISTDESSGQVYNIAYNFSAHAWMLTSTSIMAINTVILEYTKTTD